MATKKTNWTHFMTAKSTNVKPLYEYLYDEFHSRSFPVIRPPVSVSHLAFRYVDDNQASLFQHLLLLCKTFKVEPPESDAHCYYQDFGEFLFRWESHTEFCTYTVISPISAEIPFTDPAINLLPDHWLKEITAPWLAAIHVEIRETRENELTRDERLSYFEGMRVINAYIGIKQSELWSSFRLHSDGFNRAIVFDNGHNKRQLGILLRSLLEMETYRNIALLSLPTIMAVIGKITKMEVALAELISKIGDIDSLEDEKAILTELTTLAAGNERLISQIAYRINASNAYFELTYSRLDELKEKEELELTSIKRFVERRLRPAHKTCNAVYGRLEDFSGRIERASQLLRTRINVKLESQNQQLLLDMEKRSKVSLALQETVEGLSIAVITYYVISLLKISVTPGLELIDINPDIVVGISVPFVLGIVWFAMRKVRKKIVKTLGEH